MSHEQIGKAVEQIYREDARWSELTAGAVVLLLIWEIPNESERKNGSSECNRFPKD